MKWQEDLYSDDYFSDRFSNDKKRINSYYKEKQFLEKYTDFNGVICDVGCATGEFLDCIGWEGQRYGMEVNAMAIEEAKKRNISFERSILTEVNFFDVVVFRGTIQHLPSPFIYMQEAYSSLVSGGIIVFLATPNANSVVYKIHNTLPALGADMNFYIPSDITLTDNLKNIGIEILEINYPYWNSPYIKLFSDHLNFILSIILHRKPKYAFWGNMMNVIGKKP